MSEVRDGVAGERFPPLLNLRSRSDKAHGPGLHIYHPKAHCRYKKGCCGIDIHFTKQVCPMNINRVRTDAEAVGNVFIAKPARKGVQHLAFAVRQLVLLAFNIYRRFGVIRDNPLSGQHFQNAFNNIFRMFRFNKQAMNARIEKLRKQRRRRRAGDNHKPGVRRPGLGFEVHFKPVRAGHAEVKNCAIRRVQFNQGNGLNTIGGDGGDPQTTGRFDIGFHPLNRKRVVIGNDNCFIHNRLMARISRRYKLMQSCILMALAAFLLCTPQPAQARPAPVPAADAVSTRDLSDHIDYFLDPSWDVSIKAITTSRAGAFKPITSLEPDFGYIDAKAWLRVALINTSEDTRNWRVYVRENFLQHYDVYIEREDGRIEHLEKHTPETTFSERSFPYPELVTPVKFNPGESITLYISYWSEGSSHASLSFETAESFSAIAVYRNSKNYISYGMMVILIVASLIALVIFRLPVFVAYLVYVILTLVYLLHVDGVAFQYFWPGFPRFNSWFSIIVGTAFVLATYNFARVFLQTKVYHPRADKILFYMGVISVFIIVPAAFFNPQLTKQILMPLILLAIIAGTCVGIIAARTRLKAVRFYLFAWGVGILSAGLMNMRHLFGFDITQDVEFDSIRISIVVDAVMMGLGIADRYLQTQKARQEATRKSLVAAERNLRLSHRLHDLEDKYTLATQLAGTRDQEIKNTVHDLQQPLHALRLNVLDLKHKGEIAGETEDNIDEAFSYLETLIANQLDNTVSGGDAATAGPGDDDMGVPDVLKAIHQMFKPDAQQKGLEFTYVRTYCEAGVDAFVLMRIISNLVSNAIKYTPDGKVLMGVRRRSGGLRIEVHDTGTGLTPAEFALAKTRHVRLGETADDGQGHGYGLQIAAELAEKNGLTLSVLPGRNSGASLALDIPAP